MVGSHNLGAGDTAASKNVAKACLGGARVTLAARLPNGFRSTSSLTHQPCLSRQIHPPTSPQTFHRRTNCDVMDKLIRKPF